MCQVNHVACVAALYVVVLPHYLEALASEFEAVSFIPAACEAGTTGPSHEEAVRHT